jgi:hyperosmotically inducible protein
VVVAVAAILVLPRGLTAQVPDETLAQRAAEAVQQYPQFSVFDDVNVLAERGALTLSGRVTTPEKKDELGKRVAKVDGVKSVNNQIGVLPPSSEDRELRRQVATAIYNNPAFWRYAELANPPIHIVIEHQRITLTGVVDSPVDRMLAYSLAQVPGALSVTNQLRVIGR